MARPKPARRKGESRTAFALRADAARANAPVAAAEAGDPLTARMRKLCPQEGPTAERVAKSGRVTGHRHGQGARLDGGSLPQSLRQMYAQGALSKYDLTYAARFIADYDQALVSSYSSVSYGERVDGGGSDPETTMHRALGSFDRLEKVKGRMTPGVWTALVAVCIHEANLVDTGGQVSDYTAEKLARVVASSFIREAMTVLRNIYG